MGTRIVHRILLISLFLMGGGIKGFAAEPPVEEPVEFPKVHLTLQDVLQRVLDYNETIQMRGLEWLARQRLADAERGIFEPELVGSAQHVENVRETTVEQRLSLGSRIFDEDNNLFEAGVETTAPMGTRFRIGSNLRILSNNLQRSGFGEDESEYVAFTGVTVTQPLLRNAGLVATMSRIRLAEGESELAYQDYRRELMQIVARAEAAYWNLYFTQEEYQVLADSVEIAKQLHYDNEVRLEAGRGSRLEVLEAESGVALRRARMNDSRQRMVEAVNQLTSLFSGSGNYTNMLFRAVDKPAYSQPEVNFFQSMKSAFESNPDYLSRRRQLVQQDIRLAFARNQKWPQLDLTASYGLNGLSRTFEGAYHDIGDGDFENWSVGLQLNLPLGGNIRARNELDAAKIRKKEALLGLKQVETQIGSALDSAIFRIETSRQSVSNYQSVVEYNRRLLETELARLEAGQTDSRKVLEVEENLASSRISSIQGMVNLQRALIEWELLTGNMLKANDLDLSKEQLHTKAEAFFQGAEWGQFHPLIYSTSSRTEENPEVQSTPSKEVLQDHLQRKIKELNETERRRRIDARGQRPRSNATSSGPTTASGGTTRPTGVEPSEGPSEEEIRRQRMRQALDEWNANQNK